MTDRREVITTLTFAIESIKVDRAYDLMYEKVDFIEIPEGATNGDMIKAMWNISDEDIDSGTYSVYVYVPKRIVKGYNNSISFDKDWWNSPYRKDITTEHGLSYADGDTLQSAT